MDLFSHTSQNISPILIYMLVAVFLLLESCGIPLVNTTLLLLVGAMASLGRLNVLLLLLVALLGSMLGACLAYSLGKRYGEALLLRLARVLHIDQRKVLLAQRWFQTAGIRMIFLSRIVPYIRPFSSFLGGIADMPFQRFFWPALSGSFIWCSAILVIGWELGPRWKVALHLFQQYTLPTIGFFLVLIGAYFVCQRSLNNYLKRHLSEHDEEPKPNHDLLEV